MIQHKHRDFKNDKRGHKTCVTPRYNISESILKKMIPIMEPSTMIVEHVLTKTNHHYKLSSWMLNMIQPLTHKFKDPLIIISSYFMR